MGKYKIRKQILSGMLTAGLILSTFQVPVFAEPVTAIEESVESGESPEQTPSGISEEMLPSDGVTREEESIQKEESTWVEDQSNLPEQTEELEDKDIEVSDEVTVEQKAEVMDAGTVSVICESEDPETGNFKISVKGVTLADGESILIPVWQEAKQKDLIWNKAVAEGQDYVVRESVAAHQYLAGEYQIHVYRQSKTGELSFLTKTSVQIKPEATAVTAKQVQSQLEVELTGVKLYGYTDTVKLAVWSEVNGQDDLNWVDVRKQADGSWKVMLPLNKYKGVGLYHVHAYAFTKTNVPVFLQKAQCTVAAAESGLIQVYGPDMATGEFTVTISDISAPMGISQIQVPIWCAPDQSDLIWYTAVKQGDSYVAKGNISKHNYHTGTYQIHVYLTDSSGYRSFLTKATMKTEISEPQIDAFSAVVNGGSFTLSADRIITPFPLTEVKIAVWNKADQSDLIWYTAEKEGERYVVSSSIEKHKNHTGVYQAHLYLVDPDGKFIFGSKTSFTASLRYSELSAVSSDNQAIFRITLSGVQDLSENNNVKFAVWSDENGQDDLRWYDAIQSGSTFSASVSPAKHRSFGTYQVHAYVFWPDSTCTFIGKTTFSVSKLESNVIVTEALSQDMMKITLRYPVWKGENASSVTFPTWTEENGQDDLIWYKGVRQADGSFQVIVNASDHKHSGKYITHVYVSDGISQGIAGVATYSLNKPVNEVREFDAEARAVMRKIIYAVETGGQVYGRQRYDAFTEAYTNSSSETAITIGAGQWFATEAKNLLTLIKDQYPSTFIQYDTAGIAADLVNADWRYYGSDGAGHRTILKGSAKAIAIQNIISSAGGMAVQDSLVDEQMVKYADQAKALGVTDLKARLFCANIQHLGGYNAMVRIINYCKTDGDSLTMENLWLNMREREAGSGNKVGSDLYATRHQKVMQWLNTYL